MTMDKDEDDVDEIDHELVKCYRILNLFMKNLPNEPLEIVDDRNVYVYFTIKYLQKKKTENFFKKYMSLKHSLIDMWLL